MMPLAILDRLKEAGSMIGGALPRVKSQHRIAAGSGPCNYLPPLRGL